MPDTDTQDAGLTVVPPPNLAYSEDVVKDQQEVVEQDLGEPQEVDVDFTIVNHLDPRRQADPHGVYLDDVQRQHNELLRARAEGRDPDLENPPPYAGDVLVRTEEAKLSSSWNAPSYPVAFTAPVVVGQPQDEEDSGVPAEDAPIDPRDGGPAPLEFNGAQDDNDENEDEGPDPLPLP